MFAKRPAFGGRGEYRERKGEFDKRAPRDEPRPKKAGERIAKVVSRAGLASRRDAEEWIVQGRVSVNGRVVEQFRLDGRQPSFRHAAVIPAEAPDWQILLGGASG